MHGTPSVHGIALPLHMLLHAVFSSTFMEIEFLAALRNQESCIQFFEVSSRYAQHSCKAMLHSVITGIHDRPSKTILRQYASGQYASTPEFLAALRNQESCIKFFQVSSRICTALTKSYIT